MALPCPLCHTPSVFPGPAQLLASVTQLTQGPSLCPVPLCGYTAASLDSLILHLTCHSDNITVLQQHQHHSDNNTVLYQKQQQQLESDNIEQVIKDLEDLVDSEIELKPQVSAAGESCLGSGVMTDLTPDIITQPLSTWSCPTPDSGLGSQMQSPQGSNISLQGYQSFPIMSGQSFQLNSTQLNLQADLSTQVSHSSISNLLSPPHPGSLTQSQYPGPEAGAPHYTESLSSPPSYQAQLRVTGPARGQLSSASHPHKALPYKKPAASGGNGGHRGSVSAPAGPVECEECGWMFDNASFLHLHRVLMHSRRQRMEAGARGRVTEVMTSWRCDQCPRGDQAPDVFTDMTQFTAHLKSVHGDHRHVCKYCAKMFKLKGSLLVHQRVMHQPVTRGSRDKGADVTETNVTSSGDTGGRGTRDIEMPDSGNTQIGPGDDTKLEEMTQITCKIDNKVALSDTAQSTKQSQDTVKQWDCSFCGKKFTTKYFLKKHIRLHTGETPYSCNICGKTFSFQQSYHKHMLYHTDEKPHSCKVCSRSFKELSTLQNHERIHSGERPFVCETCGKSFRQRVSYLVHRRIHTGALPYSCDTCGRKFRYKVTQRTHKCSSAAPSVASPGSGEIEERSNPEGVQQTDVSNSITMPPLSQEIKKDLLKLKQAQGRRQFSSRIQNILSKTHKKRNRATSERLASVPSPPVISSAAATPVTLGGGSQPLSELSRLCLEDLEPLLGPEAGDQGGVTIHSDTVSERVSGQQLEEINNVFIDFNGHF